MMLYQLFLLVCLAFYSSEAINCGLDGSCYAETDNCDPNSDCETVVQFDKFGNMNVYMRNATAYEYVSIVNDRDLLNTMEYFICVPFSGQRFRAMGRNGDTVLFTQQNVSGVVEKLGDNYFRCIYTNDELAYHLLSKEQIVVSRGRFNQMLRISEGIKMHKLEKEVDTNDELASEYILPTVHKISGTIGKEQHESVFSSEENKAASKIVGTITSILGGKTRNAISKEQEDSEAGSKNPQSMEYDNEDTSPETSTLKTTRSSRPFRFKKFNRDFELEPQNNKKHGRPFRTDIDISDLEDIPEDDEEMDLEDQNDQKKYNSRKNVKFDQAVKKAKKSSQQTSIEEYDLDDDSIVTTPVEYNSSTSIAYYIFFYLFAFHLIIFF